MTETVYGLQPPTPEDSKKLQTLFRKVVTQNLAFFGKMSKGGSSTGDLTKSGDPRYPTSDRG